MEHLSFLHTETQLKNFETLAKLQNVSSSLALKFWDTYDAQTTVTFSPGNFKCATKIRCIQIQRLTPVLIG